MQSSSSAAVATGRRDEPPNDEPPNDESPNDETLNDESSNEVDVVDAVEAVDDLTDLGGTRRMPAIIASELVKSYPGRRRGDEPVHALRGLGFSVPPGTIFGLLGPNGAGKSTAIKILTTLSRADTGSAAVAGFDVMRQPHQVRRLIGVVTQKSGVDLEATGRENLALQGRLHGLAGSALARRIDELLDRFGLAGAADRLARTYSGGMTRRLDVAVGLVHRPRVLFLDEPTTGLDPQARAAMWEEIERLAADGLTILLTTHYLEEADKLAATVALVEGGRIVVSGSPEDLKSELRGDAVCLDLLATPEPAEAAVLRRRLLTLLGVTEAVVDGRQVRARVDHGASALPSIFAAFEGTTSSVAAATIARPSLDDVYLRYVGHRFGADGGADGAGADGAGGADGGENGTGAGGGAGGGGRGAA
jgi:ABC-2 type transport system ATP-binding protein